MPLALGSAAHVHAVTVDPAGRLLAATHDGLCQVGLAGGRGMSRVVMSRVGTARNDFMSLAVAADESLLASGRSVSGSTSANPLGVVRSMDAGANWAVQAFAGVADVHSIAVRGRTVVATDGAALHISHDEGRT